MLLKTFIVLVVICQLVKANPKGHAQYMTGEMALAPGVFYAQERAIPAGVQRPVGRPGSYGSGSKSALRIGDWTAQWSQADRAWYYYNHNTKVSTWLKPPDLRHVIFANPKENEITNRNDVVVVETPEKDVTVGGWLDNLSNMVIDLVPNPWGGEKTKNTVDRGDSNVFGLELDSGGTFSEAFTETLKESAMYKNVVKETLTFGLKLGGWTLLNFLLYQGAIFQSSALQRFFGPDSGRSFQSGKEGKNIVMKDKSISSEKFLNITSVLDDLNDSSEAKYKISKRR